MFSGANPGSTERIAQKLRTISPAPTTSTTASAISVITSVARSRRCSREPDPVRPGELFNASAGATRCPPATGSRPKTTATTADIPNVTPRTVPSTAMSFTRGIAAGATASNPRTPANASAIPTSAAAAAINALSTSSC